MKRKSTKQLKPKSVKRRKAAPGTKTRIAKTKENSVSIRPTVTTLDIPQDVVFIIFDFLSIDVSLYAKYYSTNDIYRAYLKRRNEDPLMKVLYGYFTVDMVTGRRTVYKLYRNVQIDFCRMPVYSGSTIMYWRSEKTVLNPFTVSNIYKDLMIDFELKTLMTMSKDKITSFHCPHGVGGYVNIVQHISSFQKNLRELVITSSDETERFCKSFTNDASAWQNLKALSLGNISVEVARKLLVLPKLRKLHFSSHHVSKISGDFVNPHMKSLTLLFCDCSPKAHEDSTYQLAIFNMYPNLQNLDITVPNQLALDAIISADIPQIRLRLSKRSWSPTCFSKLSSAKRLRSLNIDSPIFHDGMIVDIGLCTGLNSLCLDIVGVGNITGDQLDLLFYVTKPNLRHVRLYDTSIVYQQKVEDLTGLFANNIYLMEFTDVPCPKLMFRNTKPIWRRLDKLNECGSDCGVVIRHEIALKDFRRLLQYPNLKSIELSVDISDRMVNELAKSGVLSKLDSYRNDARLSQQSSFYFCKQETLLWNESFKF